MSEFPCDQPVTVNVTMGQGCCIITAEERGSAAVTVEPFKTDRRSAAAAEETEVTFDNGQLRIRTPESMTSWLFSRGESKNGAVKITIKVPTGSSASVKTSSAEVQCHGDIARANLTSASGPITVARANSVKVNTASGEVHVYECVESGSGNSASGDIQFDHVGGDLSVKSVSGDVRVGRADSNVNGNSVSGDISVDSVGGSSCRLKTVSGSIGVGIPSGTGVWMDLNTVSGTTSSDLAVGDLPGQMEATLDLRANSVSGNIDLYRTTS
ncbi:MAG TPA: DUF4097 domain-containing protein [Candidatus Stackebrandtia faecavium]|nr:DUF4097 domain-containing protein [Candidatus Stackebrandtia faecavium]